MRAIIGGLRFSFDIDFLRHWKKIEDRRWNLIKDTYIKKYSYDSSVPIVSWLAITERDVIRAQRKDCR